MNKPNIYVIVDHERYDVNFHKFAGGEVHVNIANVPKKGHYLTVFAYIRSNDDLMLLLLLTDALKRNSYKRCILHMPYIPYARQDRVCAEGDAFSLKVFVDILSTTKSFYNELVVCDPHSQVSLGLLYEHFYVDVIGQYLYFTETFNRVKLRKIIPDYTVVAPDKGATHKAKEVSAVLSAKMIQAYKERDPSNGRIFNTYINENTISGNFLIVDDICDGGATFIELAKVLKNKGADKVMLHVTHGIFSKGKQVLHDNGIDYISCVYDWTTM